MSSTKVNAKEVAEEMEAAIQPVEGQGPDYFIEVDGVAYELHQDEITGGEIMDLASIPREQGLLELLDDGTQRKVGVDEEIDLKPGKRYKKRPRFRRG